jgi:hypothetical protein
VLMEEYSGSADRFCHDAAARVSTRAQDKRTKGTC